MAGISAGIIILIMSLTGVLLTYEKQMLAWADRGLRHVPTPEGAARLPAEDLVATVQQASGAPPTTLTLYAGSAAVSAAAGGNTYYVNGFTGELLGASSTTLRGFFRTVTDWHRYVALSGDSRPTGKAITGAANLIFLFIVASGIVIWWPRSWSRPSLRGITWFKGGLRGKARNFNWHNVFGFWTAVPLFLVVVSATVISYPWATNLVYRITGTEPPAQSGGSRQNAGAAPQQALHLAGVDRSLAIAESALPDWKTISLRLPTSADAPLVFTLDRGNGGQPQLRSTLTLDRTNAAMIAWDKFEEQNLGRRTRSWLRFLHTGEFYGFIGQTVAGIASFAGVMLVWTGFALSLRRLRAWFGRRAITESAASPIDPSTVIPRTR
jgi:uncharacterized iron-regulated membrane protein